MLVLPTLVHSGDGNVVPVPTPVDQRNAVLLEVLSDQVSVRDGMPNDKPRLRANASRSNRPSWMVRIMLRRVRKKWMFPILYLQFRKFWTHTCLCPHLREL